ncbi:hypothetical protein L6R52_44395, partial [Myxococcota bacterium]|nr:hypothetical protein [Myxococcota bacterium]
AGAASPDAAMERPDAAALPSDAGVSDDAGLCTPGVPGCCAEGLQDDDGDGICSPACDVFWCGPQGTCAVRGNLRVCTCNTGYAGDTCADCASGYEPTSDGCVLDLPSDEGLALWLDADTASSFRIGRGDIVAEWTDRRGIAHPSFENAQAAQRPAYRVASVNGRTTVGFDGDDDALWATGFEGLSGDDYTAIFVVVPEAAAGGTLLRAALGGETAMSIERPLSPADRIRFIHRMPAGPSGGESLMIDGVPAARPRMLTARRTTSGALDVAQLFADGDGGPRGTELSEVATAAAFNGPVTLTLGASFEGAVAEILIYERSVPNAELDEVHEYLAAKWGL